MSDLSQITGQRIRMHRQRLGLTQEELAERAKLHSTYIGQVERGEKNLTLNSLERILTALGVPLCHFFEHLGASEDYKSFPNLCYEMVSEKSPAQQERIYRILCELDDLMEGS